MKSKKTVNICGLTFKIRYQSDVSVDDQPVDGSCDYKNQVITIKSDLPAQQSKEVLMHEVLHGVMTYSGATNLLNSLLSVSHSERQIKKLNIEEAIIRIISPHITVALDSLCSSGAKKHLLK